MRGYSATNRVLGLAAVSVATAFLPACGSGETSQGTAAPVTVVAAAPDAPGASTLRGKRLGRRYGRYDAKTGAFTFSQTPPAELHAPPGAQLENFVLDANSFTLATTTSGFGLPGCLATQFCANVTLQNNSAAPFDNIYVEILSLSAGVTVGNSAAIPNGFSPPLGAANGQFSYGTLTSNQTSTQRTWKFNDPTSVDFTFIIDVYESARHTGYTVTGPTLGAVFPDACASGGTVKLNGVDGTFTDSIPWPVTVFGTTKAPGVTGQVAGSQNGIVNLPTGGAYTSAAVASDTMPSTKVPLTSIGLMPFWGNLTLTTNAGQVCTLVSGAAPTRSYTITWNNVDFIVGGLPANESMSFSLTINEGATDVVEYAYLPVDPTSPNQTGGATISGIQGPSTPAGGVRQGINLAGALNEFTPFLSTNPADYPIAYTLTGN